MHIDHTTFRTGHLEETRDFLMRVFDLTEGPRPASIVARIKGHWLYHNNAPLIHLIESQANDHPSLDRAAEAIDHTAFFMENYEAFVAKLKRLGIQYSPMELPDINERRIFIRTPTGILLETVFRENH